MKKAALGHFLLILAALLCLTGCGRSPARAEIEPGNVVLEGAGSSAKLEAKIYDKDGKPITDGVDIVWFSEDTSHIKLGTDGTVTAVASGEAEVEIEIVGTEIKATTSVRVKIPSSVEVSHDKLRLWVGQVKDNVWAEVRSEKGAFIEGLLPEWGSEDPTIVKVEPIKDPGRRQSWVRMTGMKSGNTHIYATFKGMMKSIRVGVFDEDEEVAMDGTRIKKSEENEPKPADKSGKKKKR